MVAQEVLKNGISLTQNYEEKTMIARLTATV